MLIIIILCLYRKWKKPRCRTRKRNWRRNRKPSSKSSHRHLVSSESSNRFLSLLSQKTRRSFPALPRFFLAFLDLPTSGCRHRANWMRTVLCWSRTALCCSQHIYTTCGNLFNSVHSLILALTISFTQDSVFYGQCASFLPSIRCAILGLGKRIIN